MNQRRRKLIIFSAVVIAFIVAVTVVVHLPSVQRSIWKRLAASIEKGSGWRIEAGEFALRAMPARLRASGVTIGVDGRTVVTMDRLEVRWRWLGILTAPHRLELLVVEGVDVDTEALPERSTGDDRSAVFPWKLVEIGELRVLRIGGRESIAGVEIAVGGLNIDGHLVSGAATARISADRLLLIRAGRVLDLGKVDIEGQGSEDSLRVERLELTSSAAELRVNGKLGLVPATEGRFEVDAELDLETVAGWWDPNLVAGLEPAGRLELDGHLAMTEVGGLELELGHRGRPIRIAGYDIEELGLAFSDGRPRVYVAHPGWGRATVTMTALGVAELSASLDGAPVDRVLAFATPRIATVVGQPATLSGEIEGTVSYPILPELLVGRVDLVMQSPEGRLAVRGEGAGKTWRVAELELRAAGAVFTASGTIDEDGTVAGDALLTAVEPRRVVESIARWMPAASHPAVGGGPIEARVRVGGVLSAPKLSATVEWTEPVIGGQHLEIFSAEASGALDDFEWKADVSVSPGSSLIASGTARPLERTAEGIWEVRAEDLEDLVALLPAPPDVAVQGLVEGKGRFAASASDLRVEGEISAPYLAAGEWSIANMRAVFAATPEEVVVRELAAEAFSGIVEGGLTVSLAGLSAPASADLRWRNIDLGLLPVEMSEVVAGLVSGRLHVDGSFARPEGDLEISWFPHEPSPLLEEVRLFAGVTGGVLKVVSERIETAAGRVLTEAVVPLGDLRLPDWVWPGAPGGPIRATLEFPGFSSAPLRQAFGLEGIQADAEADVRVELSWNPRVPERPIALVEANNLRIRHTSGDLVAEGPLVVSLDGNRLELAPVVLVGLGSRIEASAVYDPATELVAGRVRARLAPEVTGMLPIPLTVEGPIMVNADFEVPAERSVSMTAVRGRLNIDHRNGRMVMREPPLEVRDLRVVASLDDDVIDILEGGAEVNRGRVELGGGWSPSSGQGVVLELEDVTMLVAGILTKWDGDISVEPSAEGIAHVVGDLRLAAGLWDENFALASAVFGPVAVAPASDDPLHDISLDIAVRGRSGIRVDNNLGRFDASWDRLLIGGTAAIPVVEGEVRIAPGGTLSLAGQEITVRRGNLRFTGDPTVDPIVEIVPMTDTTMVGDEGTDTFDATLLATRGLAKGLSSVLGFENETLQPAEIAVQTEKDPGVNFMIGQRLTSNLALFLTTNLTNVQDRTTMLQLWNLHGFRGLALQAYQQTAEDNLGLNLFQRFQWGGTRTAGDRPEIRRLRLEDEWPMSKRALRKSTRLRRGQPFDPFLLFVAAVRMERTLAEQGYQEARVTAAREGSERSPTLVFRCDPGHLQVVEFEDDVPPARIRKEVTALYRPPPLEEAAFANMRAVVMQHSAVEGFPKAQVTVARRGEEIVVGVGRGEKLIFGGLALEGVPEASAPAIRRLLGSSSVLVTAAAEPDRIATTVTRVMANQGYLDARVLDVEVVRAGPETAEVRIAVEPGSRRSIDDIHVVGHDPLGLAAADELTLRAGDPLDRLAVDVAARGLRGAYHKAGYRDARVHAAIDRKGDGRWVVEIEIEPGQRRTVRDVRFTGTRGLSERVLRKGLTVTEGEVLTDAALDHSASRIANFAPIERIEVRTPEKGNSETDIEIDVVKKPRWTAEVGGGWSTERGVQASFGLRDDNLFARGVGLNFRGSLDATEKRVFLIGSLPPTPGSRLSLISTVGYSVGDAPDEPDLLEQEEKLLSFEVQYAVSRAVSAKTYYRWTNTHTYEKDPDFFFPIDSHLKVGVLGLQAVVDRFDSLFDPRSGYGLTSDLGWSSSAVGSELEYVSWLTNFTLALEPFSGSTWIQTTRAGIAEPLKGTNLDREARFFAGGQSSIRGFDLNSVGPVTYGIEGDLVPAGGGGLFILNEELRIPVWGSLRAAVFADIGQVWERWGEADLDFSIGVGFGVRWSTPIGPLWADVAWPVANIGISSSKPKFYLGFGRPF